MRWKLIERPRHNSLDTTVYLSEDGKYVVCKEFYAAGPSMFSWMLYRTEDETYGATSSFINEFATKKAASEYVDGLV